MLMINTLFVLKCEGLSSFLEAKKYGFQKKGMENKNEPGERNKKGQCN